MEINLSIMCFCDCIVNGYLQIQHSKIYPYKQWFENRQLGPYRRRNCIASEMLQKSTEHANIAIGARLAIMFFVTLTSNVKFLK